MTVAVLSLKELFERAEVLRSLDHRTVGVDVIRDAVNSLVDGYKAICLGRSSSQVWYRARRCEGGKPFACLSELIYPAKGSPSFGRVQLPGSHVLYASWNIGTALEEIGPKDGDLIQVIALRPIEGIDLPCHVVGEYQSFHNTGRTILRAPQLEQLLERHWRENTPSFVSHVVVDSVLSDLFRRRAEVAEDYKVTAVFSEILHERRDIGLIYPSVRTVGGMNLAVGKEIFDSQFEIIFTQLITVERSLGYGFYQCYPPPTDYFEFESDGRILWESKSTRDLDWTPQGGLREKQYAPGWRVPMRKPIDNCF